LQARLLEDPELRATYLDLMNLDVTLGAHADARTDANDGFAPAANLRPVWVRPFIAAAAGLMMGGLAVGAVWAYAAPKQAVVQAVPLVDASFEAGEPITNRGVPESAGSWSADPHEVVESHGNVRPHDGTRMLRFLAASADGDHVGSKRMASDMYQVVELPGSGPRTVKVRAWFNAETEKQARFHLLAIAGAGDAVTAPNLWAQRYADSSDALASCRTMIFVDHDPATWETGDVTLEVPAEARVLVIGLAAYRLPVAPPHEWFPAQFADDVSVTVQEVTP
jgi:hypothetical protein